MKLFLAGGAGYIGSHTAAAALDEGHEVVIYDNLSNSQREVLPRIAQAGGHGPVFIEGDIRDEAALLSALKETKPDAVVHFAALKAVGESVEMPWEYYENNVGGTFTLLKAMKLAGVTRLVFSSSATVYGDQKVQPVSEGASRSATNPYGKSKWIVEMFLEDFAIAHPAWNIIILRYFNPAGAHPTGLLGGVPSRIPNNLTPYLLQVATGVRDKLSVFGNDYPTSDGTGERDYIHVVDLAEGHIAALLKNDRAGVHHYNLGTGVPYSVLQMVQALEDVSGRSIPYEVTARRAGDVAACFADASLAKKELGWEAKRGLRLMMEDGWRFQSNNPKGYLG